MILDANGNVQKIVFEFADYQTDMSDRRVADLRFKHDSRYRPFIAGRIQYSGRPIDVRLVSNSVIPTVYKL